jgi:hypothetical protein
MHHIRHTHRWLLAAVAASVIGATGASIGTATAGSAHFEAPGAPAVMREVAERAQIARWAIEHHLVGLAPESVGSVPATPAAGSQGPVPGALTPLHPGPR